MIKFELGKRGETKGKFKKVNGTINIANDIEKSSVSINLSLKDFTTKNAMRDDHLMSDEYFNEKKYPGMKYRATKLKSLGSDMYELQGKFTMLGVTQDIPVKLKRIELEGKKVLIGSGELDRTKFGMTPSATEGNVVKFKYQLELK